MLFDIISIEKIKKAIIHLLIILAVVAFQSNICGRISLFGASPLVVPLAVVAVGMLEGGGFGVIIGFIAGRFTDLCFLENTVMFTILFPVIGFLASFLTEDYINKRFFSYLLVCFITLLGVAAVQSFRLLVFGSANPLDLIIVAILQAAISLPFGVALYFLYKKLSRREQTQ